MRVVLLICLFAAAAIAQTPSQMPKIEPGVSEELAKWRAVQYSNISYKLNLTLEKMSPVLKGSIEIRVTQAAYACAEPNCPPLAIVLDWRKLPGHEKDSTISNVTLNGTPVNVFDEEKAYWLDVTAADPFAYRDHLIFRNGVRMGENVIKLDFTSPILTSGSAITRYIDKEDGSEYIYSLFVPSDASTAFPCFDQPDLKARFEVKMWLPESWQAVSNTTPVAYQAIDYVDIPGAKQPDHVKSLLFPETQPISTYVFAFAAGPFQQNSYTYGDMMPSADETYFKRPHSADSFAMNVYVRRSQATKFAVHRKEVGRLTYEAVKYLQTYFDYKFPFPKLDLVLIPEFPFGGMEHAGAIFLREDRVIFPAEPTKGDYLTRANLIFHEAAHQWFGDTVTMRWFDDLWLKEGFAEFMAYKTLEKVMPDANAWKVFYERNKQAAYLTDSTRGTTPIYQKIDNLSAAKSAYGNIVYRKAPSFLRQAEFYLGEDKFQTAVRAFLKKHEFGNATWEDLVKEFEGASGKDLKEWAAAWVTTPGVPIYYSQLKNENYTKNNGYSYAIVQEPPQKAKRLWPAKTNLFLRTTSCAMERENNFPIEFGEPNKKQSEFVGQGVAGDHCEVRATFMFANYQDYGYGIFLLDDKSRDYVLKHIGEEKDPFLRSMMWGALWDSVREAELDPREYVELVIKNLPTETDETIAQSIASRVSTALNYYIEAGGNASVNERAPVRAKSVSANRGTLPSGRVSARNDLRTRFEDVLLDRLQHAPTAGQRITFYRAYVANASTPKAHDVLKQMLTQAGSLRSGMPLRTKDKFDIVTRLIILDDPEAPKLLAGLEKTETGDDAKRYAYAAHAAFGTAENKAKFFNDFLSNKDISESWIESAVIPFNTLTQADLTQPYLERALNELPNLKRTRKIFFINNWLAAWIGGQRDQKALDIVNKFLADNPGLDNDLRLKVLENIDLIERAVKIRNKYPAAVR